MTYVCPAPTTRSPWVAGSALGAICGADAAEGADEEEDTAVPGTTIARNPAVPATTTNVASRTQVLEIRSLGPRVVPPGSEGLPKERLTFEERSGSCI